MDGVAGASINTGSAINAFVRVDERYTLDIGDRAFGAFAFASAAVEAGIGINSMSHELSPFGGSDDGSYFTLVKTLREEYHNWIK